MTNHSFILAAELLGLAFACGLNLYATVALLGLAARLAWIDALPVELQGLENPVLIASAALLYIIEFVIDKVPYAASIWDTIHTFIRPSAATLLALGALGGMPLPVQLAGAFLAGGVALIAHGSKAGLRLTVNTTPSPILNFVISIGEDILAVALAVVALRFPIAAMGVGGAVVVIVALVGPRLWRAFHLGIRALIARLRGFFGRAGWRGPAELPEDLRALLDTETCGWGTPRVARAAVKGVRGVGAYRNGWLVLAGDNAVFVYRSLFRPRRRILTPCRVARIRHGALADVVFMEGDRSRFTVFLLKDGPAAELLAESPVLTASAT